MNTKSTASASGFFRIAMVAAMVLLQVLLILFLTYHLRGVAVYLYIIIEVVSLLEIMVLVSRNRNSAFTLAWVLVIALLPVFGQVLYLLWGRSTQRGKRPQKIRDCIRRGTENLPRNPQANDALQTAYPDKKRLGRYLENQDFPAYQNTECTYFPQGELLFEALIKDMKQAKEHIFISTFILSAGKLWDEIKDVLIERAENGVDVRLMFDDFGSILTAPKSLTGELKNAGVRVARFNPIHKYMTRLFLNYRNHQKIFVIDRRVAYTGGVNVADEYANLYPKHGHWKDTGIRMEGEAAYTLTVTFIQMWESETDDPGNYRSFIPPDGMSGDGYFQPFSDGPVNNADNPAETMYRQMINGARDYVYITTPYLVLSNSMTDALCTAAAGGVDVRIIVPKVWDHWYVRAVSRSNYKPLLESGVRIYEYTPGFMHAKMIISDDEHAVLGSINMDYRSFNLHFENGVWICGAPVLKDVKADIDETLGLSEEITLQKYLTRPWYVRLFGGFMRVFAVLM